MAFDPVFDPKAINAAADKVREIAGVRPDEAFRVGIVLGTGLGGLAEQIDVQASVPYGDIPNMPTSTVQTHAGQLLLGTLEGTPVVAMQGRFHGYEGYSMAQVAFPIRVMNRLGAETLIVSAATGGMHPLWAPGDLVLLDDHINLMGVNPLVGPNLDEFGPRFPDMSEPYDRGLQERALEAARDRGIVLRRGVYVAILGPNLETRAEYRMLRAMGADVVGMSTVPEVITACHMGMRVMGITIITDQCLPDALEPADIDSIIKTANEAEPSLTQVIQDVVRGL